VNGKIVSEHINPVVCILAAGTGSRLGPISQKWHKSLLPLNTTNTLAMIIDKVPVDYPIVIAVGHLAQQIRDFCKLAYPTRVFTFVDVDIYIGPDSGPGYSLSKCKQYLQRPFYVFTSDGILLDNLPSLDYNWLGIATVDKSTNILYSTVMVTNEHNVLSFKNKSDDGYSHVYTGIAGIKDYKTFWDELEKNKDVENNMVVAFYDPLKYPLKGIEIKWHDVGTDFLYEKIKNMYIGVPLNVPNVECASFIYNINNICVKLFCDQKTKQLLVDRMTNLPNLPLLLNSTVSHGFNYQWIQGCTLYDTPGQCLQDFVRWCKNNLWVPCVANIELECKKFYYEKTMDRLAKFKASNIVNCDNKFTVNGVLCKPIYEILTNIDWYKLYTDIRPTKLFHGDLQPDNVIWDGEKYTLIDWRDFFGGSEVGDEYYDHAKLYGGLVTSYKVIREDKFQVIEHGTCVTISIEIPEELVTVRKWYENWLLENKYDLQKIKLMTSLIYLNMSPLHPEKIGKFMFYTSLLHLTQ
jgi:choline kinase/thiamine kinase-like enzyme